LGSSSARENVQTTLEDMVIMFKTPSSLGTPATRCRKNIACSPNPDMLEFLSLPKVKKFSKYKTK
jgi:hypothetical protein